MNYQKKAITLKNGKTCVIRQAEEADAEALVEYLKAISAETRNVNREPEEVRTSVEEEAEFIRKNRENDRALMLLAFVDGRLAGNASFHAVLDRIRVRHRCGMGISVYQEFWGMGIGTALMGEILRCAGDAGFEQMELEVVSANEAAVGLYRKFGFEATGTVPHAFRYQDGTYADFLFMVKRLA